VEDEGVDLAAEAIASSVVALRARTRAWRAGEKSIGLVPTMGALHEGHLSLIRAAKRASDRVIVSIFVNPRQFGPNEDYQRYPRSAEADVAQALEAGAALVFAPSLEEMYPPGYATTVSVAGLSEGLCGARRPGHFDGVATVVTKLLLQALPDVAFFGEKDYQQLQIVKRLVRDLDIPVRIEGVPTVREADGLALSSRNLFLSPEERRVAPALARTLAAMAQRLAVQGARVDAEVMRGLAELRASGIAGVEYLEVRDAQTLAPLPTVDRPARILVAARLGQTRLIDNCPVEPAGGR